MKSEKNKLIKFAKNFLVEARGAEAFAMDTDTGEVFHFKDECARVVKLIWNARDEGITKAKLLSGLEDGSTSCRDQALTALKQLAEARMIEGFSIPKSKRRASLFNGDARSMLILGSLTVGAGMLGASSANAAAYAPGNCSACTGLPAGTCIAGPTCRFWNFSTTGYLICTNGSCS